MSDMPASPVTGKPRARNYSAFDSELTHQALNARMFLRLMGWLRPYRITVFVSLLLVLIAAAMSVLLPVIVGRVVIDGILLPNPVAGDLPDYGLVGLTQTLADGLSVQMLTAAGVLSVIFLIVQAVFSFGARLALASASLKALRDLRLDLFASLERKPATFFDHVAVGRVMTRVSNDVESLVELLMGFGMLAGEFVPFFLAMFLMLHLSVEVTGVVALAIPLAAFAAYFFRQAMRQTFRLIRNSVSSLNQYMQEDLSGIEVVQLSGREAMNIGEYRALNQENRRQEFRAINYEVVYDTFNTSLGSIVTAGILWYGGGEVILLLGPAGRLFTDLVTGTVAWLNRGVVRRLASVILITGSALLLSWALIPPMTYLPQGNQNLVIGFLIPPPGYNNDEFIRLGKQVESALEPYFVSRAGKSLPHELQFPDWYKGDKPLPTIPNFFYVAFGESVFMGAASSDPTNVKSLEQLFQHAYVNLPDVFGFAFQTSLFERGITSGNSIDLEITGNDMPSVSAAAGMLFGSIFERLGPPRPEPANFNLGAPEYRVQVDEVRAAEVGVSVQDLGFMVQCMIDGAVVSEFEHEGDLIDIKLVHAGGANGDIQRIEDLPIFTRAGRQIPLSSVATVEDAHGAAQTLT